MKTAESVVFVKTTINYVDGHIYIYMIYVKYVSVVSTKYEISNRIFYIM